MSDERPAGPSPDTDASHALVPAESEYARLLADVRAIITQGQRRAAAAVNAEMVQTYWRIGERIVREEQGGEKRAAYGEGTLTQLGQQLSVEFGRGYSKRSLEMMRQFYLTYPKTNALRSQLAWTHYRILMRQEDPGPRSFYERMAVTGRWSSRELERQINSMLYERVGLSRQPEELVGTLPQGTPLSPYDEAFRDPYLLDFLGLQGTFSERDLEGALVHNIEKFLLELGTDFAFMSRQRRLSIGQRDYYVDLVFYHRGLRCPVLIDLKIGEFSPADAAQMTLYLNWMRQNDWREGEGEPIGLILCGSKDEQVVELLLSGPDTSMDRRIKVAQYLLLNNEEALKRRLAQVSAAFAQAQGQEDAVEG